MSPEWIAIILTAVCMVGGLIGQALYITWHASKWNTTMEFMTNSMTELKTIMAELSKGNYTKAEAKEDFDRRDTTIKLLWGKFDDLKDQFTLLKGKVDIHLIKEESNHGK